MPDISPATGQEILSYRGDPGLAAGAAPGIYPQSGDPFSGVASAIDQVNAYDAQMAVMKYKQRIKDQEDLANMLAQSGGSVFNMRGANGQNMSFTPLPQDQQVLDAKAKDLRSLILRNPQGYMFDPKYLDAKNEYNSLVNHAGVRSVAHTNMNDAAAKTNDKGERQDIIAQRDSEIGGYSLTDMHMPEPHLPNLTSVDPINMKDWSDKKKLQQFGEQVQSVKDNAGRSFDYKVQTLGIPTNVLLAPLSDTSTEGLINSTNYYNRWKALPSASDPAYIQAMNAQIDAAAQQRGVKPVYAATVNPDGSVSFATDPRVAMAAFNLQKHGKLQTEMDLTKLPADLQNLASEAKLRRAQEGNIASEEELRKAQIENLKHPKKATTEALKESRDKMAASDAYQEADKLFQLSGKSPTGALPNVRAKLNAPEGKYDIAVVAGDVADKFIGQEAPEVKATQGQTATPTAKGQSQKPSHVYLLTDKESGNKEIVYLDKNGNIINRVNKKQAAENLLKHNSKYTPSIYDNQVLWVNHLQDNNGQFAEGEAPETNTQQTQAPAQQQNDEAAIKARLVPRKVKSKSGKIVDVLFDPVTNKMYAQ